MNGFSQNTDQPLGVAGLELARTAAPPFLARPWFVFERRALLPGIKPVKLLAYRPFHPFLAVLADWTNDHEPDRHWGINE